MPKYSWLAVLAPLIFSLVPNASQAASIYSASRCLQPLNGNSGNSTPLVVSPCHGGASEQWTVQWGQITGIEGKCIDASGGSSSDGTPAILYPCGSGDRPNQHWAVTNAGRITGVGGKCLDLADAHVTSDVNIPVVLSSCNFRVQQYWKIQ